MAATATVAVTLPVIGFLAQPANAAEADADYCAQGRVFVVPGTADPNSLHTKGLEQRYGKTADRLDYEIQIIDYPGELWPAGPTSYDQSVTDGTANLEAAIEEYDERCEGKPIVIVGYSQGARIAGDVLADIGNGRSSIDPGQTPVSGELYSDPRREGDAQGRGIELILPGVLPGITMNGSRGSFGTVRVTQFCVEGDPICDLQDPLHYPLRAVDGLLGYFVKHVTYDDDIATGPDASENSPRDKLIPSDPAIGVLLGSLGLPYYNFAVLDNPLPYPDLAVLRPLFHAVNQLMPSLPNLGHGAYLPDLYVLRDALAGNPAAWQAIGGSAISILRYPENFVRDWIAEIDRQLDDLDGARLGVVAPTTDSPAEFPNPSRMSAATAPIQQPIWVEPQDVPSQTPPATVDTSVAPEPGPTPSSSLTRPESSELVPSEPRWPSGPVVPVEGSGDEGESDEAETAETGPTSEKLDPALASAAP